jgi:hypothetical protein
MNNNNDGGFGTRKTRFFAFLYGAVNIEICLLLSVFTDVPVDFLYKMAMAGIGLAGLYITGRSVTHFANRGNNANTQTRKR